VHFGDYLEEIIFFERFGQRLFHSKPLSKSEMRMGVNLASTGNSLYLNVLMAFPSWIIVSTPSRSGISMSVITISTLAPLKSLNPSSLSQTSFV
jgi:hypothetical protein